jgi:hypothetical protein
MNETRILRAAFIANAIFSLTCALLFLGFARPLAELAGLASPIPLAVIGAGLLPFGAGLLWLSRRETLTMGTGRLISLMDAQWVLGTVVLLIGWPDLLSPAGRALAVAIAAIVASFALWQLHGARRLAAPA